MRTTVDLPDSLFQQAKLAALQQRLSLKELIARALKKELAGTARLPKRMTRPPIQRGGQTAIGPLTNREVAALMDDADLRKTES